MSTQLHELLAVENERDAASNAVLEETLNVFTKKQEHFLGKHTSYRSLSENPDEEEADVSKEMVTTVPDKLQHLANTMTRSIDVTASKDFTNQSATGQIVVDGTALTGGLPATTLLMLENRLKRFIGVLLKMPTLTPGRKWELDPDKGDHVYRDQNPGERNRTRKEICHKVLVKACENHPAQVEKWAEDVRVGKFTDTEWSGAVTPARKSEMIERAQNLLEAVKQARQRANCQTVEQVAIGDKLFSHLLA